MINDLIGASQDFVASGCRRSLCIAVASRHTHSHPLPTATQAHRCQQNPMDFETQQQLSQMAVPHMCDVLRDADPEKVLEHRFSGITSEELCRLVQEASLGSDLIYPSTAQYFYYQLPSFDASATGFAMPDPEFAMRPQAFTFSRGNINAEQGRMGLTQLESTLQPQNPLSSHVLLPQPQSNRNSTWPDLNRDFGTVEPGPGSNLGLLDNSPLMDHTAATSSDWTQSISILPSSKLIAGSFTSFPGAALQSYYPYGGDTQEQRQMLLLADCPTQPISTGVIDIPPTINGHGPIQDDTDVIGPISIPGVMDVDLSGTIEASSDALSLRVSADEDLSPVDPSLDISRQHAPGMEARVEPALSECAATLPQRAVPRPLRVDWIRFKSTIEDVYLKDNFTVEDVMKYMEDRHSFRAT